MEGVPHAPRPLPLLNQQNHPGRRCSVRITTARAKGPRPLRLHHLSLFVPAAENQQLPPGVSRGGPAPILRPSPPAPRSLPFSSRARSPFVPLSPKKPHLQPRIPPYLSQARRFLGRGSFFLSRGGIKNGRIVAQRRCTRTRKLKKPNILLLPRFWLALAVLPLKG